MSLGAKNKGKLATLVVGEPEIVVEEGMYGTYSSELEEDKRESCKRCKKKLKYMLGHLGSTSWEMGDTPGYCDIVCLRKDMVKREQRKKLDEYKDKGRWPDTEKTGAIGEFAVCNDLMRMGWYTFRAMQRNGPVDIMGISPMGLMRRFDAKTLKEAKSAPPEKWKIEVVIDHYAVVGHDGTVRYEPELPVE